MRARPVLLILASTVLVVTAVVLGMGLAAKSTRAATMVLPPTNGQFDYQIGGEYTPVTSVSIVDRDRSASPVADRYNICYVNAFQTQPDEASFWTSGHSTLLVKRANGTTLTDPDWPGEFILDTSTAAKRSSIATIVNGWIDGCKAEGFQAIAQKNTPQLGSIGKASIGFDFAIAEECQVYAECGRYTRPYGNRVIEVEYTDTARSAFTKSCSARGKNISVILRDRNVVAERQSAYHYEYC